MKPTKMRNQMIYHATMQRRSKQLSSPLSEELRKKYGKRSIRITEGDTVKIIRGEFKGVDGKVEKVELDKKSVAIAGIKKEATKGEKFDVYIHASNVIITGLNTEDKWRTQKLEGKKEKKIKESETKEPPKETKTTNKDEEKEDET